MEEPGTRTEGPPAEGQRTTGDNRSEIASLIEMVRVMIQDRERQEREITEERERRERERERRNANARTASEKKVKCELPKCDDRWSDCKTCSLNEQQPQTPPGVAALWSRSS